ncbi:MAG: class I SAM-dependent methyltransferase [Elusimicrobia bacterium]|nr:class I SAM-dependent methyltransferase [Candidatus Obscuribacterium magneticum]
MKAREGVLKFLKDNSLQIGKLLIAPCGAKADLDILSGCAAEYYGIDISEKAVSQCPTQIRTKVGDILDSRYPAQSFDAIASFLFLHHVHKVGFEPFLCEFNRILKKGGLLLIMEPSALYPLARVMDLGRMIFGNISGLVPDEAPIMPGKLQNAVKHSGFAIARIEGISFSHVRIPIPIQTGIEFCCNALRTAPVVRQLAWMVLWICRKE